MHLANDPVSWSLPAWLPDPQENFNICNRPENAALVNLLTAQLAAGWQAALPPNQGDPL